ncbi:MAG: transcriptional repressor [Armatimonadia bacterium]
MNRPTTRLTRQRQLVLDQLCALRTHPTADELYQLLRCQLPHISLGTVYRNLELLSDHGVIQRLELSGHQRRYDGNATPHNHIRCAVCDRVADLPIAPPQAPLAEAQRHTDFLVTGLKTEFVGLCPSCRFAKDK